MSKTNRLLLLTTALLFAGGGAAAANEQTNNVSNDGGAAHSKLTPINFPITVQIRATSEDQQPTPTDKQDGPPEQPADRHRRIRYFPDEPKPPKPGNLQPSAVWRDQLNRWLRDQVFDRLMTLFVVVPFMSFLEGAELFGAFLGFDADDDDEDWTPHRDRFSLCCLIGAILHGLVFVITGIPGSILLMCAGIGFVAYILGRGALHALKSLTMFAARQRDYLAFLVMPYRTPWPAEVVSLAAPLPFTRRNEPHILAIHAQLLWRTGIDLGRQALFRLRHPFA